MLSQKIAQKFKRRARADLRKVLAFGLWDTCDAYQAGVIVGIVHCTLLQAKREHPQLTKQDWGELGRQLLETLKLLRPPSSLPADAPDLAGAKWEAVND